MPVDFRLQEMRDIPGSANTILHEYEERMIEVKVPRLEDPEQLPKYMNLIVKAIKREHKDIVKCVFCEPFMQTRDANPGTRTYFPYPVDRSATNPRGERGVEL